MYCFNINHLNFIRNWTINNLYFVFKLLVLVRKGNINLFMNCFNINHLNFIRNWTIINLDVVFGQIKME